MSERRVAPHGSWASPLDAHALARSGVGLEGTWITEGASYWLEGRPEEGGRYVLVRRTDDGEARDVTPPGFDARTRVHEYGGGAIVVDEPLIIFANNADQRLYRQDDSFAPPRPITPEPETSGALRYADGRLTPDRVTLICVRERHEGRRVVNEIVALAADGSAAPRVLVSGNDFYAAPRISADGGWLAWITWNVPEMPWDGTQLWVAELGEDRLSAARCVAGGREISVLQPEWTPDGRLLFVSDETGWWNLYSWSAGSDRGRPILPREAEFGGPLWRFDQSSYAQLGDGRLACTWTVEGLSHLGVLDPEGGALIKLDLPYTDYGAVRASGDRILLEAAGPHDQPAVVLIALSREPLVPIVLRTSSAVEIEPGYVPVLEPISFATEADARAHAFFYPPTSPAFEAPQGELPPLLVISHGGPTGSAGAHLNPGIAFWTSRGFAVVDVNYRGSTGYGRTYRNALRGQWGVADVADCIGAARHLASEGRVDPERMAIRGGSAGGYTTLCALTFHDVFAAGASYFGVADIETLFRDTHKFEAHYGETLLGPELATLCRERSPIHFTDRLSCPLILFQGLEDEVVPPAQAEAMAEALERKGIPYAYLTFPGEQHGLRRSESQRRAMEAELSFYAQVFGFEPHDRIEPVEIRGLAR